MITIVGAGLTGLATALAIRDLANERGKRVELRLLERADRPGGKIQSDSENGFVCEWGPNGWLDKEPATFELCKRLGLEDRIIPAADAFKNRYLYRRGRLRAVSMNPLRFMLSGLLPLRAKLRLACEPLIPPPRVLPEDESLASFARRRIGDGAFGILIDAMQSGIYAGDPERMSVRSCFPRVVDVEREHGSLVRGMVKLMIQRRGSGPTPGAGPTGHLTSVRGGLQTLTDALAAELSDSIRYNVSLDRIEKGENSTGYTLYTREGQRLESDQLVLACPAFAASHLLQRAAPMLARHLAEIEYAPLAVVSLGFARHQVAHPLDGFGFLAPRREGLRLLGTLFSSSIFPDRAPTGHVLLRTMIGGARDAHVLRLDDDQIVATVRRELRPLLGLSGPPAHVRVFRHERAIPQYTIGHQRRLLRIEEQLGSLPGLFLTGNAYRGVGINDCAKNALMTANRVLD
jgi:oxygen-dependent protoporphyrinogen oxidase